jgi:hypothetical protein
MSPTRPPGALIFHPDDEKRLSHAPGSSISPGSGPSSIRRAQAIPAFQGALGDSGRNKLARNRREYSRAFPRVVWPLPVGESGRSSSSSSRLPRIVFPARIVFHVL